MTGISDSWVQRLAAGLPAGWVLAEATVRDGLGLRFVRGVARVEVVVRPVDAAVPCYRRFDRVQVSYAGSDVDRDAMALIDAVCARVGEGEARLPDGWGIAPALATLPGVPAPSPGPGRPAPVPSKTREGWLDLELRITLRCDECCPFCNTDAGAANVVEDRDAVLATLRDAAAQGCREVVFSGGEPTLVPWLADAVREAKRLGLRVVVQTNGVAPARPDFFDRFRAGPGGPIQIDQVQVSFHTRFPDRLPAITGRGGTFDRKVATVRTALALGIRVFLNFVIHARNLDELEGFPDFVADTFGTGLDVIFSVVAPVGAARARPDLLPRAVGIAPRLALALDRATARGLAVNVADRSGVPFCVLPTHLHAFSGMQGPRSVAGCDPDHVKPSTCGSCRLDGRCFGIWTAYAAAFGTDEFQPLR